MDFFKLFKSISFTVVCLIAIGGARAEQSPAETKQSGEQSQSTSSVKKKSDDSEKAKSNKVSAAEDTNFSRIMEGLYKLESGTVLVHENSPLRVQTPHCEVFINAHSAVLISTGSEATHVLDLYDWRYGSVKVEVGPRKTGLKPGGEMALITADSEDAAKQTLLKDGLNRRRVSVVSLGNNQYGISSQFSIVDSILKRPLVAALKDSKDKQDRDCYQQIVKTAAALYVSGPSEPYAVHQ